MNANPFILALRAALLVLLGILGRSTFAETDQTAAPIGEFFDPDNLENIGKVRNSQHIHRLVDRSAPKAQGVLQRQLTIERGMIIGERKRGPLDHA